MKKVGVFSGGGSFGAHTVGILNKNRPNYDVTYGCSTGALIAPFAALGDYQLLKDVYTNVTSRDIFTYSPFNGKGHLSAPRIFWRLIRGKITLGDTTALRNLIKEKFTEQHYDKIKLMGKDVCINVTSMVNKQKRTYYVYLSKVSYEDFCFFMWASTCVPIACSLAQRDVYQYTDGGLTEGIPISRAIEDFANEIDVYLHDEIDLENIQRPVENIWHNVARTFGIMREEIKNDDMLFAKVYNQYSRDKVKINIFRPKNKLGDNALMFDKQKMLEWYSYGYNL